MPIQVIALALLVIGALLWTWSRRMRAAAGMPPGRIVSADTSRWLPTARPLFSRAHQLTGKPDYVIREGGGVIPVEVKSARAPADGPRPGHVLQLAAYCLLVNETEGRRPPRGLLKYQDAVFEIQYTPDLERAVLDALKAMRRDLSGQRARRTHTDRARCASCGYRHACDERLA